MSKNFEIGKSLKIIHKKILRWRQGKNIVYDLNIRECVRKDADEYLQFLIIDWVVIPIQ